MNERAKRVGIFFSVFLSAVSTHAMENTGLAQQPVTGPVFIMPPKIIDVPGELLSCPAVIPTPIELPAPVYDMERGDCALLGKTDEVEAWLHAMEEAAAFCQARQESSWDELVKARDTLEREIKALPTTQPSGGTRRPGMPEPSDAVQTEPELREGWRYTNWLNSIRENTINYCNMVDELPKKLSHTCNTIRKNVDNNGGGATSIQKMVYRQWLTRDLNATRSYDYDAATQYYNDILRSDGLGNFRRYFSEDRIRCETR